MYYNETLSYSIASCLIFKNISYTPDDSTSKKRIFRKTFSRFRFRVFSAPFYRGRESPFRQVVFFFLVTTKYTHLVVDRVHQSLVGFELVLWVHLLQSVGHQLSPFVIDDRVFGPVTLQNRRVGVVDGSLENKNRDG